MSKVGNHNPEWLSAAIFNGTFDWAKSTRTTFPTFLDHVTFHDSYWEAMHMNGYNELLLVIKLDTVWNKEYTEKKDISDNWPFLVINIPDTLNICCNSADHGTTIGDASSVTIRRLEIEKMIGTPIEISPLPREFYTRMLKCKELHKTRIEDISGGYMEILHESTIQVLLIEEDGKYLNASPNKVPPLG